MWPWLGPRNRHWAGSMHSQITTDLVNKPPLVINSRPGPARPIWPAHLALARLALAHWPAHLALARLAGPFGPGPFGRPIWPWPIWPAHLAVARLDLARLANFSGPIFQECSRKHIFRNPGCPFLRSIFRNVFSEALGAHFSGCHFPNVFSKTHFPNP